ncbi:MAG: zinc ribbon domain-containing protein [Burkholderiaceae bacterium]|nr:zinc ribbon domain-containing protein [Burkholderiaceae bacterium]
MPIYAYKCTACGHAQDVLQKMSDKTLTVCPECHQETYAKQVTAAGFQLKGSGWYVTDFRSNGGGDKGSAKTSEVAPAVTAADSAAGGSSETAGTSSTASTPSTSSGSAASASAPASTSASTSSSSKPASGGSAA